MNGTRVKQVYNDNIHVRNGRLEEGEIIYGI